MPRGPSSNEKGASSPVRADARVTPPAAKQERASRRNDGEWKGEQGRSEQRMQRLKRSCQTRASVSTCACACACVRVRARACVRVRARVRARACACAVARGRVHTHACALAAHALWPRTRTHAPHLAVVEKVVDAVLRDEEHLRVDLTPTRRSKETGSGREVGRPDLAG
eukprot:5547704-Pleurochrysis_carterae.AAC.1